MNFPLRVCAPRFRVEGYVHQLRVQRQKAMRVIGDVRVRRPRRRQREVRPSRICPDDVHVRRGRAFSKTRGRFRNSTGEKSWVQKNGKKELWFILK